MLVTSEFEFAQLTDVGRRCTDLYHVATWIDLPLSVDIIAELLWRHLETDGFPFAGIERDTLEALQLDWLEFGRTVERRDIELYYFVGLHAACVLDVDAHVEPFGIGRSRRIEFHI